MTKVSLSAAVDEVASREPVLARLVALAGLIRYLPRAADGHFGALVRGIVYQQLGWRAAQAICAGSRIAAANTFTPEAISALSDNSRIGLART